MDGLLRGALAELFARASSGERSTNLAELAQHVRELLQLLDEGMAEIAADPAEELRALAGIYEDRGVPPELARQVAEALHAKA